ncbi:hypothetical protein HHI36_005236 [Cryptolaemus montrouzieri]|uniref:Uncharacterized protein n=1 Tax=Cryptolaemus montrouzieri TaxID=559131 RepID=A0ABD2NTJ3_9CUCU
MDNDIAVHDDEKKKPLMVTYYNKHNAEVDTMDQMSHSTKCFQEGRYFSYYYNAIPDTAIGSSLVTASNDSNITEERTVEPHETLEENCIMSHQSNKREKCKITEQSEPSAVSDILIIPTMNKPSKEARKKKTDESKKQTTKM